MRTAVVTITHRRDAHLHRQRLGLAAAAPDLHVVVAMGREPALPDVPGAPPTTLVTVPVPAGGLPLAAARNAGVGAARSAGADLLVLLDVDCIPDPALLSRYADAAAGLRGTGPALLCGPVGYLPPPPAGGYPADRLRDLAVPHPARPVPGDGEVRAEDRFELFWSLSFAITGCDWEALGGFCEDYTGYGGEDTDFAMTAAAAGARMFWVGGAWAYHQHHPSTRAAPGQVAAIVRNAHTFHRRWGWWPMSGWLAELAEAGAVEFDPHRDVLRLR
ncbi:glycosyltransferase family 2 protein [Pseudonocardia bannensis]|uniref:Glycosyltransferase family 2 protein n=1 Tax=Pseudonocardia bannensis TaxID=630973 RepID=A0A848DHY7_9PSEU|nr:galactosyltransferase-related protein [Pseudonocardia bannensis]NMH92287.1 glycosyltransferase family 2 protein [Pseudonocardia bannensis]